MSSLQAGDEFELETAERLAQGGEAVGKAPDGRVVFVRGGAPQELCRVRIDQSKPRYAKASLVEVVRASPIRRTPACDHADRCGGCGLLHLDLQKALEAKLQAGLDVLRRVGGWHGTAEPPWSQPFAGRRTRVRWLVESGRIGFRQARSNRLAVIDHCPAVHPALEALRMALEQQISPAYRGQIRAICSEDATSFVSDPPFDGENMGAVLQRRDPVGTMYVAPDAFSQASWSGNEALLAHVSLAMEAAGFRQSAVELYSGSGNFTRLLARLFRQVAALEVEPTALKLGERLKLANVRWVLAHAEEAYKHVNEAELCLVDPPRAGLDPAVIRWLSGAVQHLIYVSCDAGTLARDLRSLGTHFTVSSLRGFDLYPGTPHLEWLVSLRRSA